MTGFHPNSCRCLTSNRTLCDGGMAEGGKNGAGINTILSSFICIPDPVNEFNLIWPVVCNQFRLIFPIINSVHRIRFLHQLFTISSGLSATSKDPFFHSYPRIPAVVVIMGNPQLIARANLVDAPVEYHQTGFRKNAQPATSFSRSLSDNSPRYSTNGNCFLIFIPYEGGAPTSLICKL